MDFCKLFNIDVRLGRGLWCANGGEWREFDKEETADPTTTVFAECAGISAIAPDERKQVLDLVDKILVDQPTDPGPTRLIEHKIRTSSNEPVRHKHRRMVPSISEQALKIVEKWSEKGVIEPSDSDYSNAPVMVTKSDGTYRMCIDYRNVNARTIKDAHPAQNADTILDGLRGARYTSKIDLEQAFLQVPMESSKKYVAFSVPGSKLCQFRRMPFGLHGSPATFCRLVDSLFGPECYPNVFKYIDDIIIVTETFAEHMKWVEHMLRKLVEAGLKVNKDKCEFCCSQVRYVGYLLDEEDLRADPDRIAPIVEYPPPKNVKTLRRFLGMEGYYARFLERDSEIVNDHR